MVYLNEDHIQKLKEKDRYACDDRSKLAAALQTWWNLVAGWMPASIAPNAITLSGGLIVWTTFAVVASHVPTLEGEGPSWIYFLAAFAVFAFQTLDAVDGKQARKTNSSSKLGDFIDHGTDIITTPTCFLTVAASVQLGPTWLTWFSLVSVVLNNYFVLWEANHTGVMYFADGSSITEGQVVMCVLHLITGFVGTGLWRFEIVSVGGFAITPNILAVVGGVGGVCLLAIFGSLYRVFLGPNACKDRSKACYDAIPGFLYGILATVWLATSPSDAGASQVLLSMLAIMLTSNVLCGRVILARLAGTAIEPFPPALLPLTLIITATLAFGIDDAYMVPIYFVVALLSYLRFYVGVTVEMAYGLGVPILTLPKSKAK